MALPSVNISVSDGGLGQTPASSEGIPAFVGVSSAGPHNQAQAFNDAGALVDEFGAGPLVEAAAFVLAHSGGPVVVVRAEDQDDASIGQVIPGDANEGDFDPTFEGKPFDHYDLVVTISRSGEPGEAAFRYSLDGGRNVSSDILVPGGEGKYEIPNTGLVIEFPVDDGEPVDPTPAHYVAGDTFAAKCEPATVSDAKLGVALDELVGTNRPWEFAHVLDPLSDDETEAFARITLVGAKMNEASTGHKYAFAVVGLNPEMSDDDAIDLMFNVDEPRVQVVGGTADFVSPLTSRVTTRSAALAITQRQAGIPISEDPGRVRRGSLPGVTAIHRDERLTPGLDAARVSTLRTHIGRPGYYVTSGKMGAVETSDYNLVQRRRVIDRACAVVYDALLNYLNESIRVDAETGFILESDAASIEAFVGSSLEAAILSEGHALSASVSVYRTDNILATNKLRAKIRLVPLAYARQIEADVGFENPAIQAA